MLVLTRKPGQSITIQLSADVPWKTPVGALFADGPIEVVVNRISGNQVLLGVTAHPKLVILRKELSK